MSVFSKIKGIFYDEVEVDEPVEEVSKDEKKSFNKIEANDEPKVEKIKFDTIDDEPKQIRKEKLDDKNDNSFSERDLFRSERTFNFTEFDDEEEEKPKRNALDNEVRTTAILDIKSSVPEHRVFKPTPVISPIYGILDKDYKKEEIREKTETASSDLMSIKVTNYDSVRRKAYGTLEDQLEDSLNSITDKVDEVKEDVLESKEESTPSKVAKIEELISKIDDVSEEIDKSMSIGELEDNVKLENFDDEEKSNEEEISDSSLEHDLFNLIDTMYDDKED